MKIDYLGDATEEDLPLLEIPYFLNTVRVGWPSPADDYVERPLDLNEYLIKNSAATYFVRVSGDSMINANIGDGAVLIVDRSIEPTHNKIVIASIDGSKRMQPSSLTEAESEFISINSSEKLPSDTALDDLI